MSTKYVVCDFQTKIQIYECTKETAAFVWLKGLHCAGATKKAKRGSVFDTWEEAHAELTRRVDAKLSEARRQLEQAQGFASNVRGMKPPQGEEVES